MRRLLPRAHHRRASDERGFTLPEMLIALAIETIIFGALATAFVVVLNGGSTVNENLKRSSDARFAASYIASDARNSSGPEMSLTDTTSCPDPKPAPVLGAADGDRPLQLDDVEQDRNHAHQQHGCLRTGRSFDPASSL